MGLFDLLKPKVIMAFVITLILTIFFYSSAFAHENTFENGCDRAKPPSKMDKIYNISGYYVRETENEKANLTVKLLPNGSVHITGMSRWRLKSNYQPTIKRLNFEAPIKDGHVIYSLTYTDKTWNIKTYKIELTF